VVGGIWKGWERLRDEVAQVGESPQRVAKCQGETSENEKKKWRKVAGEGIRPDTICGSLPHGSLITTGQEGVKTFVLWW